MDGWKCPVCGKGVAPDQKTCDHEGARDIGRPIDKYREGWPGQPYELVRGPVPWPEPFICDACRRGGVCNCYIPERDSAWCGTAPFVGTT